MTLLGVVTAFLVDIVIAATFGVGVETDAFFAAYTVPISVTTIIVVACDSALVPLFAQVTSSEEIAHLLSAILNLTGVILALLTLTGVGLSERLIRTISPGLSPSVMHTSAELTEILFMMILPFGLASVLRAFFFARRSFAIPAAIYAIQNVMVLAFILLLGQAWGIMAVAIGYTLGAFTALVALVGLLRWRFQVSYYLDFDLSLPGVRDAARLIAAPAIGLTLRRGMIVLERGLASYLGMGSITALSYANRISFVVVRVFLSSVMTAFMPVLSDGIARQDTATVNQNLLKSFKVLTLISVPVGTGLSLMSIPVVKLLFQRGAFDQSAVLLIGSVLGAYSLSIVFMGHFQVIQSYFYSAIAPARAVLLFVAYTGANVVLAFALVDRFGPHGLALAFTFATALATVVGYVMLYPLLEDFPWRGLILFTTKVLGASVAMASTFVVADRWFTTLLTSGSSFEDLLIIGLTIGLSVLSFIGSAWVLQLSELTLMFDFLRSLIFMRETPEVE